MDNSTDVTTLYRCTVAVHSTIKLIISLNSFSIKKTKYFNLEVLIIHLRRTKSPTCVVISHMSGPKNTLKCCLHRLHVPHFFKQSERDEGQRKAKLTNILVAQAILVYNMIRYLCIDMVRQFSVRLEKMGR